jgi:hypothetical protein
MSLKHIRRSGRAAEQRDELAPSEFQHETAPRNPLCQLIAASGCPGSARRCLTKT